jgi:phasin family protein
MATVPEQFAAAAKAHFEAQLKLINTLTAKAFEGVEKVIELNVGAARQTVGQAGETARKLGASGNPQEFLTAAKDASPDTQTARDYARQMAAIATSMHAEFSQAAESQVAETRKRLAALVEEATRNAPAGSEQAIAAMNTVLKSADTAYEQLTANARKAVETMQASISSVTEQSAQAMDKATRGSRPKG